DRVRTLVGSPNKPVWFTEYGYQTADESVRSAVIGEAMREESSAGGFFLYGFPEVGGGTSMSILNADYSARPAFTVMQNAMLTLNVTQTQPTTVQPADTLGSAAADLLSAA